jgi:hypothetical protein
MKSMAPILALFVLIGLGLYGALAGRSVSCTAIRVIACSPEDAFPAFEAALLSSGFHPALAVTRTDGGSRLAAGNASGTTMDLVINDLPTGQVQLELSAESRYSHDLAALVACLDTTAHMLRASHGPRSSAGR